MTKTFALDTGADIPQAVKDGLEIFCKEVEGALAEELLSVVLYGGIPRDEYYPHTSDINIMVVVKEVSTRVLDLVGKPARKANLLFRLTPLVLSQRDLERSTDVFPTVFLSMRQYHQVLSGVDPFEGLEIGRDHLRLRCEQELKNLLLELRSQYLQAARPERIEATLTRMMSPLVASLSTLLVLGGHEAPKRDHDVIRQAARHFELDSGPLRDCLALKNRKSKPGEEDLKKIYDAFMAQVEKAAEVADQLGE